MNKLEISKKTIELNHLSIGKSIKGKGTEIFSAPTLVYSSKTNPYTKYIEDDVAAVKKLVESNPEGLYLQSFYIESIYFNECTYEKQKIKFSKFLKEYNKTPEKFYSFNIYKKRELLGFISLSKYKSDRDSQIELAEELVKLQGYSVYGNVYEWEADIEFDETITIFKRFHNTDTYYSGDYELNHGDTWCISDEEKYFDGRLSNYNNSVLEYFEFDESEYLKEIDPNETISVYNRKYKDWYISYGLNQIDIYIAYKDENFEYENDMVHFMTYFENDDLINRVNNCLKAIKNNLEVECFVYNELDEDYDYKKTSLNLNLIELLCKDKSFFIDKVFESISYDTSKMIDELTSIYNELIYEKVSYDNYKIKLQTNNGILKYNHLALIKKLEKRYGYELVNTSINGNNKLLAWAFKKDNEEYHFDILQVIINDITGNESLKDFIISSLDSIQLRKLEKIEERELFEKASHVFVGFKDSISSGNCEIGTKEFIQRHKIDLSKIGGIRGDSLLDLEKTNFTLRAVNYAIINHSA